MEQILFIGPSTSVKGGITTVVKGYLNSELSAKYKIYHVSTHRDGNKLIKLLTAFWGLILTLFYLIFKKIAIVHIHGSDTTGSLRKYYYFKLIEKFNCKTLYHFHGASFLELFAAKPTSWQHRIIYLFENADKVICLSKDWEEKINRLIPAAKTVVVENAVPVPDISCRPLLMDDKPVSLLFLGLIGERKGIFDLLPVIRKLKDQGQSIVLNIGGNGDIRRLENTISQLKLAGTVNFLGWITGEKKQDLFINSDIFILPSYGEGMPMSILEAMSYGLPIVSTRVGGIPDLVSDDSTGYLFQPGDKESLYSSILSLVIDRELRQRFGLSARKTIEKQYNLEKTISRIDCVYRGLLGNVSN